MRYVMFSVRDRTADVFAQPFFSLSVATAIRGFSDTINNPDSGMLHQHPDDFDLYQLGFFDDLHATFEVLPMPTQVAVGKDLVKPSSRA